MKKRILSIFLAALMIVSLLPVTAFAALTVPANVRGTWTGTFADEDGYTSPITFVIGENSGLFTINDDFANYSEYTGDEEYTDIELPLTTDSGAMLEFGGGNLYVSLYYGGSAVSSMEMIVSIGGLFSPNTVMNKYVPPTYTITNGAELSDKETNHGYIVVNDKAAENETVTVAIRANEGYQLKSLKYNDGEEDHDIKADDKGAYTFKMPAKAVTVVATFEAATDVPVNMLYWGYDESTKTLYLSATEEAITNKGATTTNAFNSAVSYNQNFPWKDYREGVEHVEILNDIAPGSTAFWFQDMKKLTEIKGIEHLDTSNVWDMQRMFLGCEALAMLDVSKFNTSNVMDMTYMFNSCYKLKSIDVSKFDTSKVEEISCMFGWCKALTSLDLSGFDMSSVSSVNGTRYMFLECDALESVNLSNVNASNVETMKEMFNGCKALTSINFTNFKTSSAKNMSSMFKGCEALTSLNLSSFDTSKVTDMSSMFSGCSSLASLDLSGFDTTSVTTMKEMFNGCSSLASLDLPKTGTSELTNVNSMFKDCTSLKTVDLSNFDLSKATLPLNASYIFSNCSAVLIKTPKNLGASLKNANLPEVAESAIWYKADDLTKYEGTNLPQNLSESITLIACAIDGNIKRGTVTAASDEGKEKIILTVTPDEGCTYKDGSLKVTYNDGQEDKTITPTATANEGEYTFTMPAYPVTVTAKFERPVDTTLYWGYDDSTLYLSKTAEAITEKGATPGSFSSTYMFGTTVGGTSPWYDNREDVENVQILNGIVPGNTACWFYEMKKLTGINGIENLDTSNVVYMEGMFDGCEALTALDVSGFDTSNVTDMMGMFRSCTALEELDVSKFDTSNVTNMSDMFGGCRALATLDVSKFDTSNVTDMSDMFSYCEALTELDVSKFNTSKVTNMQAMFGGSPKLKALDVSKFNTSNVTDMSGMFSGSNTPVDGTRSSLKTLDLSSFDTSNVTDMKLMFYYCEALTTLKLSKLFNTSKVTDMNNMFGQCNKLEELDVSSFDTSKVTDMSVMFSSCSKLTTLDVSKFDTSNVTDMSGMFSSCRALATLDVSKFDTSNVTSMSSMFSSCRALTTLDVSSFDTSKVTSMGSMFYNCSALTSLDLSNFDTSKVTSMSSMFASCSKLTTLDVSSFDTSKVTSMSSMFKSCKALASLDLSGFNMTSVTSADSMFTSAGVTYLKTPKNLKIEVALPTLAEPMEWHYAADVTLYNNGTDLPKQATSIALVAGVPVDDWGALQTAIGAAPGSKDEPATATTNFILKNDLTAPATGATSITIPNGKNITLDLNGKVLNADGKFGVIKVEEGGKLTVIDSVPTSAHKFTVDSETGLWTLNESAAEDYQTVLGGVITGGNAGNDGGGVYVNDGSTFNMEGGTIVGNKANASGGAVEVKGGASFKMTGGSIIGNTAGFNGGGVYVTAGSNVTMTGGSIINNTALQGGGVYVTGDNSSFTMTGGEISGNNATSKGGGVYVNVTDTVSLGGTAQITDNTLSDGTTANNLYLPNNKKVTLGTKTASSDGNGVAAPVTGENGMKIGVTMETPGTFTGTATETQKGYFTSDNADYEVKFNASGYLELKEIPGVVKIGDTTYATFAEAIAAAQTGDTIKLLKDMTITEQLNIDKAITFDGNGFTITRTPNDGAASTRAGIQVTAGATIKNLTVSGPNSQTASAGADGRKWDEGEFGIKLYNANGAVLENVTVTGANAGIQVNGGSVTMKNNITVSGNEFGGIELCHSGVLNLSAATLVNAGETDANPVLWNDDTKGTITFSTSQPLSKKIADANKDHYYLSTTAQAEVSLNGQNYLTLADALAEVPTNGTATDIKLLANCATGGITIPSGVNLTIDFDNKTITFNKPGAGSTGTKTQAFQLLGGTVVMKNGKIECAAENKNATWESTSSEKGIAMMIQNYANLTLDGMTIDGANIAHNGNPGTVRYVMSNNSGTVNIKDTTITAASGDFAFDACKYGSYAVPTVNVNGTSVITGNVELTGGKLNVAGTATITGTINAGTGYNDGDMTVAKAAILAAPTGYEWVDNADGTTKSLMAVAQAMVGTTRYATFAEAFTAAEAGGELKLLKDMTITEQLNIDKAITFDGNGKTINGSAVNGAGAILVTAGATIKNLTVSGPNTTNPGWDSGEFGIKLYNATGAVLENVTVTGANAGIQVNGGSVTMKNNITVSGNEFGGIELCHSGVLNLSAATLVNAGETDANPVLWNDDTKGTITFNASQALSKKIKDADKDHYYLSTTAQAEVSLGGQNYLSLAEALADAKANDELKLLKDMTITEQLNIDKAITFDGNGKTINGSAVNGAGAILVTAGATIKNLTVSGPNTTNPGWDSGEFGIKLYNATGAVLENVTVTGANAGIQVNGGSVTMTGTITLTGNEYGGIELCHSGVLNLSAATLVNAGETDANPVLWNDDTKGTITFNASQALSKKIKDANKDHYYLSADKQMVSLNGQNYLTLADAIAEAQNNSTIKLLTDNSETITVNKAITFQINANSKEFAPKNITSGEGFVRIKETAGEVTTYTFIEGQGNVPADPVEVKNGEIISDGSAVTVKDKNGADVASEKLAAVAKKINEVLDNDKVNNFGQITDETGLIAATSTNASNSKIVDALKDKTTDTTAKAAVTDTGISKYLNVTLVSADVDVNTTDGTTVTVNKLVFDVTPMATITVTGTGGTPVTLTTEITKDELNGSVTFLLPVDGANIASTAAVYHEDEFLGNFDVKTDGGNKYIEVKTDSFSKFGYITLDATTAGAKIGDTLYASLSDAVSKVANDQTITLLKDASGEITVSRAVKFTVEANDKTNTAEIKAGSGYTVSKSGDTYTISAYSGGGGGASSYAVELPANVKNGKVEVSPKNASAGQTVTLTVTPDKGFTLETIIVLDKNGKEVEVKNLGNNKYSFKMPTGKVSISATFMEDNSMLNFFVDVKADDYYYDAVLWAAENGITNGVDAVHFGPEIGVTRAQVVTFLWRVAGCPEPVGNSDKFTDLLADQYYIKAVAWAIEQGITKGVTDTTFEPEMACTRGQIVTFLARFAGVEDADTESVFTDVSANEFFAAAVKWAKDNGVTSGVTDTTFEPYANCTRGQVVTFLYRWMVK